MQDKGPGTKAGSKIKIGLIIASAVIASALTVYVVGRFWPFRTLAASGIGEMQAITIVPAQGQPYAVAISADGGEVAMMHRTFASSQVTTEVIEVRDARSGREVKTFSLPTVNWGEPQHQHHQYRLSRPLSYCGGGKYLVAIAGPDTLDVIDAHDFHLRASIVLSDLHQWLKGQPTSQPMSATRFDLDVEFDCSASKDVAAMAFHGSSGILSLKLIDLEKGLEIVDLEGSYDRTAHEGSFRRYEGDGMAISPDGSRLALLTWQWGGEEGNGVDVLDTRSGVRLKRLHLGDPLSMIKHRLTFVGNDALIIGQLKCPEDQECNLKTLTTGHTLRVWNFGGDGSVNTIGWPGAETYRYFGAPASGNAVFAYTGEESYCKDCNENRGELRITDARFTIWDRQSGRAIARSSKLRIEPHTCGFYIGSCETFDQEPELQMSANGEAVLAFWPQRDYPPSDKQEGVGTLLVYRIHPDSPPQSNPHH